MEGGTFGAGVTKLLLNEALVLPILGEIKPARIVVQMYSVVRPP